MICCAMDARRGQLYNALFALRGGQPERLTPDRAISLEELAQEEKCAPGAHLWLETGPGCVIMD